MTGLPIETPFENDPQGVVNDADRDVLGDRLNQGFADGNVSAEDYRQLLDQLYSAKTKGELVPIARALPPELRGTAPAVAGDYTGPKPGDLPVATSPNLPIPRPDPGAISPQAARMAGFAMIGGGIILVLVVLLILLL
jgi:hypothetical protein